MTYRPGTGHVADEQLIGAKARNLAVLSEAGFRVPSFFVVTSDAFAQVAGSDAPGSLAELPSSFSLPPALLQEIESTAAAMWPDDRFLAVRSSAIGEDGTELSYAGQLVSFLFVRRGDIAGCVVNVWRSAFSERVTAYRRNNQVEGAFPHVAVIVQEMVDADVSGVAFGIDPVMGDRNAVVISAVYGLGEGLVSGELDADTYTVRGEEITSSVAAKQGRVVLDREGGKFTRTEELPEPMRVRAVLDDAQVREIAGITRRLGHLFGTPQDVEWCIADETLHLLQSRPVTGLRATPDRTRGKIIWDNSNIIESYAGVTTPLTFSFVRDVYSEVYRELCRILGVDAETIERNQAIFEMLGLIKGRIYYNLLNWYRVLALLPGYTINARFMETMMGVKERLEETPSVVPSTRNPYIRLGLSIYRLITNLLALPKNIVLFQDYLNATLAPLEKRDLGELSPEELRATYFMLERSLLQRWRIPILNDFYTMIFFGVLKGMIEKWNLDDAGTLHNDLLSGEGGIISTEPLRRLASIATTIRPHADLVESFRNASHVETLAALDRYPEIRRVVDEYIFRFGDRYIGELKLETVTPKERPDLVIGMLAGYVLHGGSESRVDAGGLRRQAEERVRKNLRGALRRWLFEKLLRQARERVKNRENLRFERTRVFGVVRRLFLAMGDRYSAEGLLDNRRDIFWLTKEEIFDVITGTAVTVNLRELVRVRREEFAAYEKERPADRFTTWGAVHLGNTFVEQATAAPVHGDGLSGTPCCPGVVRARVRVVINPSSEPPLHDEILVAERTDPGWAPLFPMASGLLVERGSLLSHSAIVAREMGIPAIVGISGLLENMKSGDLVEMDGARGTIRVLERSADA